MSTSGIIFAIAAILITLFITLAPFLRRSNRQQQITDELVTYKVQYDRVLTNIRDLEEDFALGKIQQDFYDTERAKATTRGVELLRMMDTLQTNTESTEKNIDLESLDNLIEAAVAAKRK